MCKLVTKILKLTIICCVLVNVYYNYSVSLDAFFKEEWLVENVKTYTPKERNMYLVGMFGQNMIYNIVATGVYYYFQNIICLPAVALGWIFAIARVWDAINDPMMGTIVDRTKSKYGKCRSWLLFAPIVICIITSLCFLNGNYSAAKTAGNSTTMVLIVAWAAISYLLWGMSFTAGDVPLWGIISRMTEDGHDRSVLISWARIIASVGGAVALVGIIPLSQALNAMLGKSSTAQVGFIVVGIGLTVIATVLFECAGLGTREHVPSSEEKLSVKENFALMWKCVPFRRLFISGILRSPFQLMMTVAMTLLSYYYCEGDLTNAFTDFKTLILIVIVAGGLFVGQFVAMALCPPMIKKFDVKNVYNFASGVSAIPFACIFLVYLAAPTQLDQIGWSLLVGLCMLLSGAGFGIVNVCQSCMISDCIDYEEYHRGFRPDGVFFSGQSFITKFSSGIASIISAYAFAAVGYTDVNIEKMNVALQNGAKFATDYQPYAKIMWFLISIPPAIGMLLAIIPTIKYELNQKEHDRILDALVERHREIEEENGEVATDGEVAVEETVNE